MTTSSLQHLDNLRAVRIYASVSVFQGSRIGLSGYLSIVGDVDMRANHGTSHSYAE